MDHAAGITGTAGAVCCGKLALQSAVGAHPRVPYGDKDHAAGITGTISDASCGTLHYSI